MKKTLAAVAAATILLSSAPSFAKTEGAYLGLDVIRTSIDPNATRVTDKITDPDRDNKNYSLRKDDKISGGVNAKYAINMDNFFIAPGVFYDYTNIEVSNNNKLNNTFRAKTSLKHRYGAKVDVGFDIGDKFAIFVNGGYAGNVFRSESGFDLTGDIKSVSKKDKTEYAPVYGAGVKFQVADNVSLKAEYERSKVKLKGEYTSNNFVTNTIRAGVAVNF